MSLHTLVFEKSGISGKGSSTFLDNAEVFSPVSYAQSLKEAENLLESEPIQVVLVEEGVPAKELHTLLEIAKANIAFVFFVGGRPVIAETADSTGLPLQLKDFKEDHLMPLLEKTDLGALGAGVAPVEGAFFAKSESVIQRIVLKDLICVEAMKDYVLVHQTRSSHKVLSSMKHFEARLPKEDFVRIHRSFIVRLSSIISIDGDTVNCEIGFKLPIGPSFRQSLLARLNFI